MGLSWRGIVWVVSGSVLVGAFVARVFGGPLPSGLVVVALALVVVLIATELARPLVKSRRSSSTGTTRPRALPQDHRAARGTGATFHPELEAEAWDALAALCSAIDGARLDWLRTNPFVTPWLDAHARAVLHLAPSVSDALELQYPDDVHEALAALGDALAALSAFYDASTYPDPMLVSSEWRFFDWEYTDPVEVSASVDDTVGGRALQMQRLAGTVAEAYARLNDAASGARLRVGALPVRS